MATLNHLVKIDKLLLYEAELAQRDQKNRMIYLSYELAEWIDDHLPYKTKDRSKKLTPYDQVMEIFDRFVKGYTMGQGDLKILTKIDEKSCVWEFKTTDVRIFGYFYRPHMFVSVCGDMKKNVQKVKEYKPHINRVKKFRKALNADPPAFETSDCLTYLTAL